MKKPESPKRYIKAAVVGVLLVIFLTAAIAGVRRYQSSRPDRVLSDAIQHSLAMFSADTRDSGDITLTYRLAQASTIKEVSVSLQNVPNTSSFESGGQLRVVIAEQTVTIPITVRAAEGKLYIRLHDIDSSVKQIAKSVPVFGLYSDYVTMLARQYNDKWIALEAGGESITQIGISTNCLASLGSVSLSPSDQQQIIDYYQHPPLFQTINQVGSEDIAGQASYHLQVADIDTAHSINLARVLQLEPFRSVRSACRNEAKKFSTDMVSKKSVQLSEKFVADVWVSKKTRQLTRVSTAITGGVISLELGSRTTVKDSNINQKVTVPESIITLQKLQSDIETILGAPL